MSKAVLLIVLLMLAGCATLGQRESSVQLPSGEVYKVMCMHDATVKFKQGDVLLEVNNQGKPGPVDSLIAVLTLGLIRTPIEVAK